MISNFNWKYLPSNPFPVNLFSQEHYFVLELDFNSRAQREVKSVFSTTYKHFSYPESFILSSNYSEIKMKTENQIDQEML